MADDSGLSHAKIFVGTLVSVENKSGHLHLADRLTRYGPSKRITPVSITLIIQVLQVTWLSVNY